MHVEKKKFSSCRFISIFYKNPEELRGGSSVGKIEQVSKNSETENGKGGDLAKLVKSQIVVKDKKTGHWVWNTLKLSSIGLLTSLNLSGPVTAESFSKVESIIKQHPETLTQKSSSESVKNSENISDLLEFAKTFDDSFSKEKQSNTAMIKEYNELKIRPDYRGTVTITRRGVDWSNQQGGGEEQIEGTILSGDNGTVVVLNPKEQANSRIDARAGGCSFTLNGVNYYIFSYQGTGICYNPELKIY